MIICDEKAHDDDIIDDDNDDDADADVVVLVGVGVVLDDD